MTNFTASEIASIIKAGKKSGVSILKLGDIQIVYGEGHPRTKTLKHINPAEDEISEQIEQVTKESMVAEEIRTKELELEEMLLTDPAQYEQLALRGDLESGLSDDTESDE